MCLCSNRISVNSNIMSAAANAEFLEIFMNLPQAAFMLSDDNIKEFLAWLSDKPREITGYLAAKVFERLTGQARLVPPPPAADLVKTALTMVWEWDATEMIEALGLDDALVLRAARMIEDVFEGCADAPPAEKAKPAAAAKAAAAAAAARDQDSDAEDAPRDDDALSVVSAYVKKVRAESGDLPEYDDLAPAKTRIVAEEDKFFWNRVKQLLPERFAMIWEKNPLGCYETRRRVVQKLPPVKEIGKVAEFPAHVGLRPHYMDAQLAAYDARAREMLRGLTLLHARLSQDVPPSPEDPMQAPDIIEALFGLGTALSRSLEQGRKALVD